MSDRRPLESIGTLVREFGGEHGDRDPVNRLRIAGTSSQPLVLVKAKQ